ncbi:MAG: circularly permuted type 2 ATP-grasp protein [Sneathiellaceae bacterium]
MTGESEQSEFSEGTDRDAGPDAGPEAVALPAEPAPDATRLVNDMPAGSRRSLVEPAVPQPPDAFDEMVDGAGAVRPYWRPLIGNLSGLDREAMAPRLERIRQQFDDNGVAYTAYGDPRSMVRPWAFDPIPVILQPADWRQLRDGLRQRARLLDALLRDLYGAQTVLQGDCLPPGLVYGSREFLRPVHRRPAADGSLAPPAPPASPMLSLYAADLVRDTDGRWRVLADRTEVASGIGYALENRRALARSLPELFSGYAVARISPFLAVLELRLRQSAGSSGAAPRTVLLTPGPGHRAYFEHVFLARELGVRLAEGADLTVRADGVFLKTLRGLLRVDLILRRVVSRMCDPLELSADSGAGVVGLAGAIRRGQVSVANDLGSGLLQTSGLFSHLPAIAREWWGEELALPSVDMLWGGRQEDLEQMRAAPGRFEFRQAVDPVLPSAEEDEHASDIQLSDEEALAQLALRPGRITGLRRTELSQAPCWGEGGLLPQRVVLRMFVLADGSGDYAVMPGGLARISEDGAAFRTSLHGGGVAKDVWVLTDDARSVQPPIPLRGDNAALRAAAAATGPVAVPTDAAGVSGDRSRPPRGKGPARGVDTELESALPSRVAEALYWIGRYTERLDYGARLVRSALWRMTAGEVGPREMLDLGALSRAMSRAFLISPEAAGAPAYSTQFAQAVAEALAAGSSYRETFGSLKNTTNAVWDRLPRDLWVIVQDLVQLGPDVLDRADRQPDALIGACDRIVRLSAAFSGLVAEIMTRGEGWRFMELGRRLERGLQVVSKVDASLSLAPDHWEAALALALDLCESTITHRSRYQTALEPQTVLHLLLADAGNPRGLAFQLQSLRSHLGHLPNAASLAFLSAPRSPEADLRRSIQRVDRHRGDPVAALDVVRDLLAYTDQRLADLNGEMSRSYFSLIPETRRLGFARWTA